MANHTQLTYGSKEKQINITNIINIFLKINKCIDRNTNINEICGDPIPYVRKILYICISRKNVKILNDNKYIFQDDILHLQLHECNGYLDFKGKIYMDENNEIICEIIKQKRALQLFGTFRTFEQCLPNILSFIDFNFYDYDVFILTQKNQENLKVNEEKLFNILGKNNIKCYEYIEEYKNYDEILEKEIYNKYCGSVLDAKEKYNIDFTSDKFVSQMWYRRYLNNKMRNEYEIEHNIKYDVVIRTRFDILLRKHHKEFIFNKIITENVYYFFPDVMSIGCPKTIDYEAQLYKVYPYASQMISNEHAKMWLFMSEYNLIEYMKQSPYNVVQIDNYFEIIR
jgi:hypothetical protein